jgi:hypothetical protein
LRKVKSQERRDNEAAAHRRSTKFQWEGAASAKHGDPEGHMWYRTVYRA